MSTITDRVRDSMLAAAARVYPAGRAVAHAAGFRLSDYPRLCALAEAVIDPFARPEAFDGNYRTGVDHWGYATDASELARHQLAFELLKAAAGSKRFGRVLEIACAEGIFTEMLHPLCASLLAVDFSEIALERARQRCLQARSVTFGRFDIRRDPIPGRFNLIVVMDVLTFIRRPARLHAVLAKLIAALGSGDMLLIGDYRWEKRLENSWLGRQLVFGGKWVIEAAAARPELRTVSRAGTETHLFALLRKI